MIRIHRSVGLPLAVIALIGTAADNGAAESREPKTYRLIIASQPLGDALQDFARQSSVQVIFFSDLTDGLRAPPLDGRYTLSAALKTLLANTELTFRVVNSRTVKIESRAAVSGAE